MEDIPTQEERNADELALRHAARLKMARGMTEKDIPEILRPLISRFRRTGYPNQASLDRLEEQLDEIDRRS